MKYKERGLAKVSVNASNLRIVFPRSLFNGTTKTLALGLKDDESGRRRAEEICDAINVDIRLGRFDPTLDRYKPQSKTESYRQQIRKLYPDVTLVELYEKFIDYKRPTWKAATLSHRERCILPLIKKSGVNSPYQALELREWLCSNTSPGYCKRVLQQVNAAFNWGLSIKILKGDSPYQGMAKEFRQYQADPEPNAFTQSEKEAVLEVFKNHSAPTNSYSHYYPLVQFMLLTGCRPSEAIGLRWGNITQNHILFKESIVTVQGKPIRNQGSKNNRTRKFPVSEPLRNFLASIKPDKFTAQDLVFPSPQRKAINYSNFCRRAWKTLVDPIAIRKTTPYSCRDTFITEQVNAGVPPMIVAKWCDTSVKIIERYYFDQSISKVLPI